MISRYIAVPLREGETVRKLLLEEDMLRRDLAITRDEENIFFPINGEDPGEVLGYRVRERDFQVLESTTKSYRDVIDIPDEMRTLLPSSFDIIGTIAVVKIPQELRRYGSNIGEAIIKANKSIGTVAVDSGVEGVERLRQLHVVAGNSDMDTVHREYGIELEVNPARVYFSPRLATEHWRIAEMVEHDEVVIDMFCGVGPFSILIAKHKKPKRVYALDINDMAIEYVQRNIKRNRVESVEPICGDSKNLVPGLEPADRIIMNLPHSVLGYLPAALSNIREQGNIHYYEVLGQEYLENRLDDIEMAAARQNIVINGKGKTKVHTYSPDSSLYCLDLEVVRGEG